VDLAVTALDVAGLDVAGLAQNYFGNTRSGSLIGPIGGFVIATLVVVTVLLIRNMNARIRRLRERFPHGFPDQQPPDQPESAVPETGRTS
jgi:uncharacterized membrane protein